MCWVREVVCALMHTTYNGVYMSSLCVHNVQAIVIFTEPIVRTGTPTCGQSQLSTNNGILSEDILSTDSLNVMSNQ